MREHNRRNPDGSVSETGTPFVPFNNPPEAAAVRCRVMPCPNLFQVLPMACTFLRELNGSSSEK